MSRATDAPSTTSTELPRLHVLVAHPDDETFGCGGLVLHAAASGWHVHVTCATRGEAGEGPTDGRPLAQVREAELHEAGTRLGVREVELLSFADSGMQGPAPAGSLVEAEALDLVETLADSIRRVRPTVVVTLDGSDGHRDHLRVRDATLQAAAREGVPYVYLSCLPRSLMAEWFAHAAAEHPDREHLTVQQDVPGTPDEQLTTLVPVDAHLAALEHAMAAHASQDSPYDGLPGDLRDRFLGTVRLRRVVPSWGGGPVETGLPHPAVSRG